MNTNTQNLLHQDGIALYYKKAIPENKIKQLFDELRFHCPGNQGRTLLCQVCFLSRKELINCFVE